MAAPGGQAKAAGRTLAPLDVLAVALGLHCAVCRKPTTPLTPTYDWKHPIDRQRLRPGKRMLTAHSSWKSGLALIALAVAPQPSAQDFPPGFCYYPGGLAQPGAIICLEVDGARSLARCEMVLNNSSWHWLHQPCAKPPVADDTSAPIDHHNDSTKPPER